MTSAAGGQLVGTPLSFPTAGAVTGAVLDAAAGLAAELAGGELAGGELAGGELAGAAAVVVDACVDVRALALALAELLLLQPLTPSIVPTTKQQAKARGRVRRGRLVMLIPLYGRRGERYFEEPAAI